jgi:hypothetical protein
MDAQELSNYLNEPQSKKVFKLLDRLIRSEGRKKLYQNIYYHSGCDLDWYFNPSTESGNIDIPASISNFLENLYQKISEMDFMDEIECDETNNSIDIIFDVKEKTLSVDVVTYYMTSDTRFTSKKIEDPEMIEILQSWKTEGHNEIKVDFSGGGDSGYIEDNGYSGDIDQIRIPASFEDFMYNMLNSDFGGWENNEGGQGQFVILIDEQTIELNCSLNYEDPQGNNELEIKIDY